MKRLVLIGGGHAHVHVLSTLATQPIADTEVTLISPYNRQVYSGMLPGWVAGHYQIDDCVIPLSPLCERAGVRFVETSATRIDFSKHEVHSADGNIVPFDTLSIDSGPVSDVSNLPGAAEHAISIRPIEAFIKSYAAIAEEIHARKNTPAEATRVRIVFVGAGAGGVELAMAVQYAFREQNVGVTLISGADTLPGRVGPRLGRRMRKAEIAIFAGQTATQILPNGVRLASGGIVEADQVFVATGASAATWPRESGLACDERSFIATNTYLQSTSHTNVFAAGDCASMENQSRPKSGVYAVRAGPPLAENLRRHLAGESLRAYVPQRRTLYLISAGDRYAIGSWGSWSWEGRWVWRWKDRIDRAFMTKYSTSVS